MTHTCTHCGHDFELAPLPGFGDHAQRNISFAEYVHAYCRRCGSRDWADERRFVGFLGPRGFYALALAAVTGIVALVVYLGFFFTV